MNSPQGSEKIPKQSTTFFSSVNLVHLCCANFYALWIIVSFLNYWHCDLKNVFIVLCRRSCITVVQRFPTMQCSIALTLNFPPFPELCWIHANKSEYWEAYYFEFQTIVLGEMMWVSVLWEKYQSVSRESVMHIRENSSPGNNEFNYNSYCKTIKKCFQFKWMNINIYL